MRTFMSEPSRDLIDSTAPSTASMVPRIRTVGVGGCCAHAAAANRVTKANEAASRRVLFRMAVSLSMSLIQSHQANTGREYLFPSHHIGGVNPLSPTLTRLASNEPSGSFLKKAMILAPAFSSDLPAGT